MFRNKNSIRSRDRAVKTITRILIKIVLEVCSQGRDGGKTVYHIPKRRYEFLAVDLWDVKGYEMIAL